MSASGQLCAYCGRAPAHAGFSYCSRTCGRAAASGADDTSYSGGTSYGGGPSYGSYTQYDDDDDDSPPAGGPNYNGYGGYGGGGYGGGYNANATGGYDPYGNAAGGYGNQGYGWGTQYQQPPAAPTVDPTLCEHCFARPKHGTHKYCGRTCGQAAKNGLPPRQPPSSQISVPPPPPSFPTPFGIAGKPCKVARCKRTEEYGSGYCSDAHRRQGVKDGLDPGCLYCKSMPRDGPKSLFCGNKCSQAATNAAPILLEVPTSDPRFTDVAGQFKTAWKHNANAPRVARVYKIILPQSLIDSYDAYKRNLEGTGNFAGKGMEPANERRRWHGTRRMCKIGDDGKNLNFCNNGQCSVCLILKNSYDVKFAAVGMFGKGIYTSATSSKSDSYTRGAAPGSQYKAMFLNRVAVGKGKILTSADNSLRAAPAGFDSIIANPGSGLNYDELIVYDNNAIRTSWLLLYETK